MKPVSLATGRFKSTI